MGCLQVVLPLIFAGISMAAISPRPLSQSMIDYVNNLPGITWKAGENFKGRKLEDVKRLCGTLKSDNNLPIRYHTIADEEKLPESFDPREKWPECPTLKEIRDQGNCGSCWAFGAVSAISDRICISSNAKVHAHISAEDVLSCCHGFGCDGGFIDEAWRYYETEGIVTGGQYGSNEGCRPYSIAPCEHHVNGSRPPAKEKPELQVVKINAERVINGLSARINIISSFSGLKTYGVPEEEEQIMMELMTHGPFEVGFSVFADFLNYKSGVYKYVEGSYLGGHAVKLLGWGLENGTKYWLLANSWNSDWGDNGYFKILRGKNECGIESRGVAGTPK